MSFLLDTHVVFWSLIEDTQLSPTAREALSRADTDVFVSVASAWEMAIKVGIEKWPEAAALLANFEAEISVPGFHLLPITVAHVRAAGTLVSPHRDPFDRLLAAQASIEGLTLVSADPIVGTLGAPVLW